jgi:hypothetical protein
MHIHIFVYIYIHIYIYIFYTHSYIYIHICIRIDITHETHERQLLLLVCALPKATAKEAQDKITEASAGSPNYHNVGLM